MTRKLPIHRIGDLWTQATNTRNSLIIVFKRRSKITLNESNNEGKKDIGNTCMIKIISDTCNAI